MELKIEYLSPGELKPYAGNAKRHPAEQVEQIKTSIEEFGFNDPVAIWKDNEVIEGHGRLIAALELGLERIPVIRLDGLTDEQRRAYTLVHNKLTMNSGYDFEVLAMELEALEMDMTQFGFEDIAAEIDSYQFDEKYADNLQKHFVVPPFSVLDARRGYWQDRKREWLEITGDLSESRDGEYGKTSHNSGILESINGGTSNFDPVLAEIMFKWFCVDGGKVLDPFGGEQTKGIVAGELGYKYHGVEIRQEQVDIDTAKTQKYKDVIYYCGDSNDISNIVTERGFDLCFTSPPYYDLEVYSPNDLSALGSYEEFMAQYKHIFKQCVEMLADDSFLVVKVGEIRNKKTGEYRCFVADNVKMFVDLGLIFYDDIVLITPIGTAPIRANKNMEVRKIVKTHQNVLVFYKGNPGNIKNKFKRLDFDEKALEEA